MLCVVTLLGRKRGHWLTKPTENEDAAWQQERPLGIPQNLCVRVCIGKRSSKAHSSLVESRGKKSHASTVTTGEGSRKYRDCTESTEKDCQRLRELAWHSRNRAETNLRYKPIWCNLEDKYRLSTRTCVASHLGKRAMTTLEARLPFYIVFGLLLAQ